MLEPAKNVISSNFLNSFRQSSVEFSLGSSLERAQGFLDLCNAVLNRIEVRRVSRYMHDSGAGSLNQLDRPGRGMKLDVVEQDEVARAQAGDEQVLDVQRKDLRVACPCNRPWRADSVQPHRADNREVAAVMERCGDVGPLAHRGAGVGARHRQVYAEFVQEDQVLNLQRLLFLLERGALFWVGFGGEFGLFFRDSPSACSPRQIVLWLTSTRAVFCSCSPSSASVASGVSATKSVKIIRAGSVNFALAPPPWGNGAMSPRSRFWHSSL